MKNSELYYRVGALLYCPANNKTIADSLINQKFGSQFSLALCLQDTIADHCVAKAEEILLQTLSRLYRCREGHRFFLPKIFIRVRCPEQITRLSHRLQECAHIVDGYILPAFSPGNADNYIHALISVNEHSPKPVYAMPIYESPSLIDLRSRYEILYTLKDKLAQIEDRVLNIRVGGNDLCHIFGFRRRACESIHQIRPVANLFSDIVTVYGMDYVVSGPVWEYYRGENWKEGLIREISDDKLCGFTGKTVIHPAQIPVVNDACRVPLEDLNDAKSIVNWDHASHSLVAANSAGERMNEYKTHSNWAAQTLLKARVFGTK